MTCCDPREIAFKFRTTHSKSFAWGTLGYLFGGYSHQKSLYTQQVCGWVPMHALMWLHISINVKE